MEVRLVKPSWKVVNPVICRKYKLNPICAIQDYISHEMIVVVDLNMFIKNMKN